MFLSALHQAAVIAIIIVVAVQYAIALFCLLKLAYLDISKREYVLWNLFILLIFFIGDAAFLIYYYKVKDKKRIPPYTPEPAVADNGGEKDGAEVEPDGADNGGEKDGAEADGERADSSDTVESDGKAKPDGTESDGEKDAE